MLIMHTMCFPLASLGSNSINQSQIVCVRVVWDAQAFLTQQRAMHSRLARHLVRQLQGGWMCDYGPSTLGSIADMVQSPTGLSAAEFLISVVSLFLEVLLLGEVVGHALLCSGPVE